MARTNGSHPAPPPDGPLFELGTVYVSSAALAVMDRHPARQGLGLIMLDMHRHGNWGDITEDAAAANVDALARDFRIISAYEPLPGKWLFVITEGNRHKTTILTAPEW